MTAEEQRSSWMQQAEQDAVARPQRTIQEHQRPDDYEAGLREGWRQAIITYRLLGLIP
jgi:hypothetical protein